MNDDSRGTYNTNSQIRFKTSMLKPSLCDYSDEYILVKGTIIMLNTAAAAAAVNNGNKKVIFKNGAPFTDCISKMKNTQIDNAEYIVAVMLMYKLIEYRNNYSKTSRSLWQHCRDKPAIDNNCAIIVFNAVNVTDLFSFKEKTTSQTGDNTTKEVEMIVLLKYISNFCRTFEMPLINCEFNLILTWSANCVIVSTTVLNQDATFAITDLKLYVPFVTLLTKEM